MPAVVVQRFVDAANARDAVAMAALVAPDAVFARFPDGQAIVRNRDGIQAYYSRLLQSLPPDFRITVEPRVVEGQIVIDQEHFAGMPAGRRQATWMYLVRNGLIRHAWVVDGEPPPATPEAAGPARSPMSPSDYLYLWASSADSSGPDFLAVYDVRDPRSADRYGALVTTLPVPGRGNRTHHTEHVMPADDLLFANGFGSGQSFIFDLSTPSAPRLAKQFGDVGALMHPHSFWRLPNGNVLATFQMQHDSLGMTPGGLVELTPRGAVVRAASSNHAGVDRRIRPYSAAILSDLDRVVVTTSDMDNRDTTQAVQLWRLSDLSVQHTIQLPNGPRGDEGYRPAEPRILSDGRTVLVSTFNCGLYVLDGIASATPSATPSARLVASFPRKAGTSCAVPVVAGDYYLITVPAWSAVVSLDVSDPTQPREVSRITLGTGDVPHWIGIEPNHQRVVITGYQAMKTRVLIARFDETTGKLALDERFRAPGSAEAGLRMEGITWPHGGTGPAVPHGAVFGRPQR
jgi:hypothetical protein